MIKLTINPESQSDTKFFQQSTISIGAGTSSNIDLPLADDSLSDIIIQIFQNNDIVTILNVANDPFVTLNGKSFGKKILHAKDRIHLGKTTIVFEGIVTHEEANESTESITSIKAQNHELHDHLPQDDDSDSSIDIDGLLRQVEILSAKEKPQPLEDVVSPLPKELSSTEESIAKEPPAEEPPIVENPLPVKQPSSLAAEIINAEEDNEDNDLPEGEKDGKEAALIAQPNNWSFLYKAVLTFIVFVFLLALMGYLNSREQSREDRVQAAEGVADVSMALAYAQVHNIKPHKQNWFDPEFLKNNLAAVVSSEYMSFANIDNQGQFSNCPYILRIYTSSDLSRFLVIAQPEASLLQYLVPRSAIVMDSEAMEMRLIADLKALNRLLLTQTILDTPQAAEISNLVSQGELLPLSSLSKKQSDQGFSPPKVLALVRPGAENKIYNSPRYYQFGEMIIKRAISLLQVVGNSHEVTRLQQEVKELSKFPNIVLYSSGGIQTALQAQKALTTFVPNNKLLTAYFTFDLKGKIRSSHLLLNDDYSGFFPKTQFMPTVSTAPHAYHEKVKDTESLDIAMRTLPEDHIAVNDQIDSKHPLYLQLMALAADRRQALDAITSQMIVLLNTHLEKGSLNFDSTFEEVWGLYQLVDKAQQDKMINGLEELYVEYANTMPLTQFIAYVKDRNLDTFAKSVLNDRKQLIEDPQQVLQQINQRLEAIKIAANLKQLDEAVESAAALLTLMNLPDPKQLMAFQNEMRNKTVGKFAEFLLSNEGKLPASEFNSENKAVLAHILKTALVTNQDEYDFYLNEFDQLSK